MNDKCPFCSFVLVENDEPLKVLQMLRMRKTGGDDKKYPLLVADFHCKKCETVIHTKWADLDKDLNVLNCQNCGSNLYASVFLGLMCGFELKSFCFSCYKIIKSGSYGFQK